MTSRTAITLLLVACLAAGTLGSTCVIVGEGTSDVPYGEESDEQALEEEESEAEIHDAEL